MSLPLPRSWRAEVRSGSDPRSNRGRAGRDPCPTRREGAQWRSVPARGERAGSRGRSEGQGSGWPQLRGPMAAASQPLGRAGFLFELQGFCGAREKPGGGGTWAQLRQALRLMRETEAGGRPERRCGGCRGPGTRLPGELQAGSSLSAGISPPLHGFRIAWLRASGPEADLGPGGNCAPRMCGRTGAGERRVARGLAQ